MLFSSKCDRKPAEIRIDADRGDLSHNQRLQTKNQYSILLHRYVQIYI